ncbi:MAG: NAD(P)/FAD-dependent oxidoreductase [Candidatus Latescibacterota bacterium]|nr:NAD(P)/FAD-dependent oxidoreductase [Candidatus Latescibacterota bacterium]
MKSAIDNIDLQVLIVGAGISGIGAGISLKKQGQESFIILESAGNLGGTWRDNTYPGVAVDIPSFSYCFSFETDYPWSQLYAPGDEVLSYIHHCAEKFNITNHIRFNTKVYEASFDSSGNAWSVKLVGGEIIRSRFLVAATGLFGPPNHPNLPGIEDFTGSIIHSSEWDHSLDLSNQRVGIIGTGASAVQIVPELATKVKRLTVFQRTPIWIGPRFDFNCFFHRQWGSSFRKYRATQFIFRFLSELFLEIATFQIAYYQRIPFLLRTMQHLLRLYMKCQLTSSELADKLLPKYGLGCKRPAISNSYLSSFNLEHIDLTTVAISKIRSDGILDCDDNFFSLDTIILATGFMTTQKGNSPRFKVIGRNEIELEDFWNKHKRQAYLGVSVPSFPNFFLIGGPHSLGFNWFTMLEMQSRHIIRCIKRAHDENFTFVEVREEAHDQYMRNIWSRADATLLASDSCGSANSYYFDQSGDASITFPSMPWWRNLKEIFKRTKDYKFR